MKNARYCLPRVWGEPLWRMNPPVLEKVCGFSPSVGPRLLRARKRVKLTSESPTTYTGNPDSDFAEEKASRALRESSEEGGCRPHLGLLH